MGRIKAFLAEFKAKYPPHQSFKAYVLLVVQFALLALLCGTLALICIVREDTFWFYLTLVGILMFVGAVALALNLSGRYAASAWLTIVAVTLGPWGSLLLDSHVAGGDFVPIVYVALSIQLCAILLSAKATGIIAAVQLAGLGVFIAHSAALRSMNWPSLVAFVVFVALLGSVSSTISRRQVKQIEQQHNRLLEDGKQLRELSVRDALTGLYNRRYMEQMLEREIALALRGGHGLGVVMADVDCFKCINDNYGHTAGDKVLCDVADMLRAGIRKTDFACRFGGDEFVLILPDCPLKDCIARTETICQSMEKVPLVYNNEVAGHASMSFGVAALPGDGMTAEALLAAADKAMYAAKDEGKGRVRSVDTLAEARK